MNGERRTANGERRTANGERRTANGERRTANGERRTANGERQTHSPSLHRLDLKNQSAMVEVLFPGVSERVK
jgi:hypothetical protein